MSTVNLCTLLTYLTQRSHCITAIITTRTGSNYFSKSMALKQIWRLYSFLKVNGKKQIVVQKRQNGDLFLVLKMQQTPCCFLAPLNYSMAGWNWYSGLYYSLKLAILCGYNLFILCYFKTFHKGISYISRKLLTISTTMRQ